MEEGKWTTSVKGSLKINVYAFILIGLSSFAVSMILRDHSRTHIIEKNMRIEGASTVFEAEVIVVFETL